MTIDSLQMELALASRLELLKASDQDVFLDATLACLRLVQNILEHSHNERYRRLRGSAPVSAKRAQEGTYWKCTCTTSPCIFAMAFVACVLYVGSNVCLQHALLPRISLYRASAVNHTCCTHPPTPRSTLTACMHAHKLYHLLLLSLTDLGTAWSH